MRSVKKESGAVGLALAAMIASACGGRTIGTGDRTGTTPDDPTNDPQPYLPPPTPTTTTTPDFPPPPPPDLPPPPQTWPVCGDGGGRMRSTDFCGSAQRQLPCELENEPGDSLQNAICRKYCLYDPSECEKPNPSGSGNCSRLFCNVVNDGGGRALRCFDGCPGGRRPEGYGGERSLAETSLGRAFARLAQLETVSIPAFGRLAGELDRLGFASDLVRRAKDAQRDEVRHARDTWQLARRFGAQPTRLERMPAARERSLLELALENVEEGCVREAFGAVVAAHQAERAADPEVRRVMTAIACDEAEHAELAWAIHDEMMTKLDERDRAVVEAAFDRACETLEAEVALSENDEALRVAAGLPDRAAALAGARVLSAEQRRRLRTHGRDAMIGDVPSWAASKSVSS